MTEYEKQLQLNVDTKVEITKQELIALAEIVHRTQKETGWICQWIQLMAQKMGVKIEL